MSEQIKPGFFGKTVAADSFRTLYDFLNEQILSAKKSVDILFFGDSITQHWDTNLFFSDYGFIVNRGIGSDTTEYMAKRADADVFQLKPAKMVFLGGINDFLTACPDLWWRTEGKDFGEVAESILGNIEDLMKKCADNNVKGYFCSVLPTDFALPFSTFGMDNAVVKLNPEIEKLCKKYGMTYVDYFSALVDTDGKTIKDGITYDGVHPKYAAYKVMAEVLKENLNER